VWWRQVGAEENIETTDRVEEKLYLVFCYGEVKCGVKN